MRLASRIALCFLALTLMGCKQASRTVSAGAIDSTRAGMSQPAGSATVKPSSAETTKKVPACPKGAVERSWTANGEKRYACQAPGQKTDQGLDACHEWEDTYWNPEPALPCGSSVSSVSDKQYLAALKEEEEHDCHKAKTLATFMGTNAETRRAFALKGATAIWRQGRVMITAAGDDKEYLLFF